MATIPQVRVPFVDLNAQHAALREELTTAWHRVLDRTDFILGGDVESFEAEFAAFCQTRHAIGVATGLDALRLTLVACGLGPGDEVLVPANTFIATALAVTECGARPVLVDCDPRTYNLAAEQLAAAVTSRTRAILPVHFGGLPADMEPILEFAAREKLVVIEDACQSHGARYRGRPTGGLATAGCFSFYPAKNLGALGDGGMVVTDDDELAQRLRQRRNYGQKAKYEHVVAGVNSRLDTLQAAMLRIKLRRLPDWNEARREHAAQYRESLQGLGDLTFQEPGDPSSHVYHIFVVETDDRDALRDFLAERGIQTGVHYPQPIHLQPAYASLGYDRGQFPHAERLSRRCLSLPMFPELTASQIEFVVDSLREWFR